VDGYQASGGAASTAAQGREKEVVIVSLVRSNPAGSVGFLQESRRLNVAVTRARRLAVLVGDSATLGTDPAIASLIQFCKKNGAFLQEDKFIELLK
jgi:superfamily I DNA and/or RNA helicase